MQISTWTEPRIEQLKTLWGSGASCAEIAADLGGITRNAVIGKLHRLGLADSARVKPERAPRQPRQYKPRIRRVNGNSNHMQVLAPLAPEIIQLRCAAIEPRNVQLLDLEPGDCRYPYGEGDATTFCGHAKIEGGSYCTAHFHLCRQQPRDIKSLTRHAIFIDRVTA